MDKYLYTRQYCGKESKPNRRYKQRFCTSSYWVKAFHNNKKINSVLISELKNKSQNPVQIEKMSFADIGNAAVESLATNTFTKIFTKEENLPATKKDIINIITIIKQRYFMVKNIIPKKDGALPYFDILTNTIFYSNYSNQKKFKYGTL